MSNASLPSTLSERYALVCDRIARAAEASGRRESDVFLVAVTKNADPQQIRELIDLGHRDLGENRVQSLVHHAAMVEEYLRRLRVLPSTRRGPGPEEAESLFGGPAAALPEIAAGPSGPVRWHMIGHLQRNKARKVAEFVRLVHSVDSLRIAEELQQIALRRDQLIEVLIQVNCSGEASKFGCPVPAAIPLAEQIETMVNVRVRGLMTIAPDPAHVSGNPADAARRCFARGREIFEELKSSGVGEGRCNLLSMGMTGDFEIAIREGANIVRVGTAIFGEAKLREQPEAPEPEDEESAEEPAQDAPTG